MVHFTGLLEDAGLDRIVIPEPMPELSGTDVLVTDHAAQGAVPAVPRASTCPRLSALSTSDVAADAACAAGGVAPTQGAGDTGSSKMLLEQDRGHR